MQPKPKIVKEPAANHRYGKDIARHGYVYAAYSPDGKLVAIAATAKEARRLYDKPANRLTDVDPKDQDWSVARLRSAARPSWKRERG
jgi:hypothetical protein